MFLEVSVTIFDSKNRYLDLNKLCEKFPGCGSFGNWKIKGDQLECSASWTGCFAGYYNNLCSKHELSYRTRTREIKQFNSSDILITDPFSAIFYMMMMLKGIPEVVTYMNEKINSDSDESVSVIFPYVDADTAAILTELEPFIKQISNPSNLNKFFDEWFSNIDPKVKTIMFKLCMKKEDITSTREELSDTPSQVESSSVEFRQLLDQFYTRQTDKKEPYLHPIEEVFGHVWYRPNGSSLHWIRRINGRDIPEDEGYQVVTNYLNLEKCHFGHAIYRSILAYIRWGGTQEGPIIDGKRYILCSALIGHILYQLKILREDAIVTNLLPIDFFDLCFYQEDDYENVEIFDKKTYTYRWLFAGMLERLGQLKFTPMTNPIVSKMLEGYDYPRDPSITQDVRAKYYNYLSDDPYIE